MDYKTNTLPEQLECKEIALPTFQNLKFGRVAEDLLVFDSDLFCVHEGVQEFDYKVFQRTMKRFIDSITDNTDTDKSQLFWLNHDGHVLIHQELTFLFLAFVKPVIASYFNGLLGEVMSTGVAYSDDFILSMTQQRVPSDVLQDIINSRNDV